MILRACFALALATLLAGPVLAAPPIRVAASTNDLASIAARVGGGRVEVFAIARPNADVHRVEVLPSYMVKVSKSQLYLKVGLDLDRWADGIVDGSRNTKLVVIDCSRDVNVLQRPTTRVDASMGDIHPNGNPHYWLDPRNGAIVARTISDALARVDPAGAEDYRAQAEAFARETEAAWQAGRARIAALPVRTAITYHASWPYFADAFGVELVGTVEPVPGIPPTGGHLASLVRIIKERRVPLLLQEPYFSAEAGRFLARETGIRVVTASPSCNGTGPGDYLLHLTELIDTVAGSAR